jgi:lipopolysaccharide/colanic/teichoic acid biosynthesis glycosyltransferase
MLDGLLRGRWVFRQIRVSAGGRPFVLYKLTTMRPRSRFSDSRDSDRERVTGLGLFLRKTSLDELPQILQTLFSDLSFYGPRPLLPEYNPVYLPTERRRLCLSPGISGLSQVVCRNGSKWSHRLALDSIYHLHRSASLDTYLFIRTLQVVLRRHNVCPEGVRTAKKRIPFLNQNHTQRELA